MYSSIWLNLLEGMKVEWAFYVVVLWAYRNVDNVDIKTSFRWVKKWWKKSSTNGEANESIRLAWNVSYMKPEEQLVPLLDDFHHLVLLDLDSALGQKIYWAVVKLSEKSHHFVISLIRHHRKYNSPSPLLSLTVRLSFSLYRFYFTPELLPFFSLEFYGRVKRMRNFSLFIPSRS